MTTETDRQSDKTGKDKVSADVDEPVADVAAGENIRTLPTGDHSIQTIQPPARGLHGQERWTTVELELKRNFEEYSEVEKQKLLQGIPGLRNLNKEAIKSLKTSRGSVHLSIPLPQTQAIHLFKLVKTGALELDEIVEMNFRNADLRQAVLTRANLRGADLSRTILSEADLSEANLRGVDLTGAYLRWVNVRGADLCGAVLTRANLGNADLRGANLTGASLLGTEYNEKTNWPESFTPPATVLKVRFSE